MYEKILHDVGFSKNETKVYLTLLKAGSSLAGEISAKSGIHRTNVYDALQHLTERGLVSYIFKGAKRYYSANSPYLIKEALASKAMKLDEILPELSKQHQVVHQEKAHIYHGLAGIKTMTDEFIREGRAVLAFGIPRNTAKIMKSFIDIFHKKRIKNKIVMKHIYDEDARDRITYLNKMPYTYARYLPGHTTSPATTIIFGEKVGFFIWSDEPLGIIIESEKMARVYTSYFYFLWKSSKL